MQGKQTFARAVEIQKENWGSSVFFFKRKSSDYDSKKS